MSAGCALTPADRYSTKMASEGASGEQPPPVQTLATTVLGSVDTVGSFGKKRKPHVCFYRRVPLSVTQERGRNVARIYFRTGS